MGLAAGACSGNGILLDIKDPRNPARLDFVFDKGIAYWHSATFNNDGTKVLFTDEWGGGGRPRCRAVDPLTWGADANGSIYGAEIARGIDVFRLKPSAFLSQNEIDAAMQFRVQEFNSQNQPKVAWQPTTAVAKAYLDQLNRTKGISAERVRAINEGLAKVDSLRTGKESNAKAALDGLDAVAGQVDADAAKASGVDFKRMTALAETLRGRTARLR